MKIISVIALAGIALATGACAAQEPTFTVSNNITKGSTTSVVKPEPVEPKTNDGRTWQQVLTDANVNVTEAYSKQVCNYIQQHTTDSFLSKNDFQEVALKIVYDTDYDADKVVAIATSSLLRSCNEYREFVQPFN